MCLITNYIVPAQLQRFRIALIINLEVRFVPSNARILHNTNYQP
jgi:hypothetical protein